MFTDQKMMFWLTLWVAPCALASESTEHGINWWHLGPAYKDAPALGWLTITFIIFVYLLVRAIRKPLSLYLETRSKDIRKQIEEARLAKEESEKKLELYSEKLKSLDQEILKMKTVFHEQAMAEKKERKRIAEEMATRILQDADDTIKASFERTKVRLANEVVTKALNQAEEIIVKSKQQQVDQFLKTAFIEDLKITAQEVQQ